MAYQEPKVIERTRDDIVWPWSGSPHIKVGQRRYKRQIDIDPTPAYSHDPQLVAEELQRVFQLLPVEWQVTINVFPVEETTRTNAATSVSNDYDYSAELVNGKYPHVTYGDIWFSGKRIPPHPATTRYLVAHEYGHVVEEWFNFLDGHEVNSSDLLNKYTEIRSAGFPSYYGAGTWHVSPAELFANDFRILVCKTELEYWPHPFIPRPEELPAVVEFWKERVESIRVVH